MDSIGMTGSLEPQKGSYTPLQSSIDPTPTPANPPCFPLGEAACKAYDAAALSGDKKVTRSRTRKTGRTAKAVTLKARSIRFDDREWARLSAEASACGRDTAEHIRHILAQRETQRGLDDVLHTLTGLVDRMAALVPTQGAGNSQTASGTASARMGAARPQPPAAQDAYAFERRAA